VQKEGPDETRIEDEVAKHGTLTLVVITGCAMAEQPESTWTFGKAA